MKISRGQGAGQWVTECSQHLWHDFQDWVEEGNQRGSWDKCIKVPRAPFSEAQLNKNSERNWGST